MSVMISSAVKGLGVLVVQPFGLLDIMQII
jgi:hypothetical protein